VSGVLADYIGRKRMLMLSILCYALFTGLSAVAHTYWMLLLFRFLTGLGLGGEWGPGAAMVSELWPPATRGRAAATLQSAYGVGILLASMVWLFVAPLGPASWRYMFLLGVLPAFLILYIRHGLDDPALTRAGGRSSRAWRAARPSPTKTARCSGSAWCVW
jgi:MFS family permease